jgi:hypothetical protein
MTAWTWPGMYRALMIKRIESICQKPTNFRVLPLQY